MPEMKTLNGYEVVDAKARAAIENIENIEVPTKVSQLENDSRYTTMEFLDIHENIVNETPLSREHATIIERLKAGEHFPFCVHYGAVFYNVEKYCIDNYNDHDVYFYLPTQLQVPTFGAPSVKSYTIYLDKVDTKWYAKVVYETVDLTGGNT